MIEWFRSWHGAATDPKWLVIGRKAGVQPGVVSAIWYALQDHASQQADRGSVATFDIETYAAFSGFDETKIQQVLTAMEAKHLISNGRLSAWEKRQPKREDDSSARVARFRNAVKRTVTHGNSPDLDTDKESTSLISSQPKSAEGEPSTIWITMDDPRWPHVAGLFKKEKGRKPPHTAGAGGSGWHFPTDWLETSH